MNIFKYILILFILTIHIESGNAQSNPSSEYSGDSHDLNIGGDIFTDFNEDLEASRVMEDERYYRYGRFFSFQVGLGFTGFDGNRGLAYTADPPSYSMALNYFLDFNSSFGLGFAFSKHYMFLVDPTQGFQSKGPGFIDIALFRVHFNYRYYVDTANLGTAITWSNPYFTGRLEYWYETDKFIDLDEEGNDSGGGLGMAFGFGLEFPVKLKESYINIELLYHSVNFHNKFTSKFKSINGGQGYADLSGNIYTSNIAYVFNW